MAKEILITFNQDGSLLQAESSAVGIRQGDSNGEVTIRAVFQNRRNDSYVAKFHFERPDGKKQRNVIMTPSSTASNEYDYAIGSSWFFAVPGLARVTVTITDGSGAIAAQGSYSFNVEATQIDVVDSTLTYDEAAALEGLIADIDENSLKTATRVTLQSGATATDFYAAAKAYYESDDLIRDGDRFWGSFTRTAPNATKTKKTFYGEFIGHNSMLVVQTTYRAESTAIVTKRVYLAYDGSDGNDSKEISTTEYVDSYFDDNRNANGAVADQNGDVIDETYETKDDATVKQTAIENGTTVAGKAYADEDGIRLKTGYAKVNVQNIFYAQNVFYSGVEFSTGITVGPAGISIDYQSPAFISLKSGVPSVQFKLPQARDQYLYELTTKEYVDALRTQIDNAWGNYTFGVDSLEHIFAEELAAATDRALNGNSLNPVSNNAVATAVERIDANLQNIESDYVAKDDVGLTFNPIDGTLRLDYGNGSYKIVDLPTELIIDPAGGSRYDHQTESIILALSNGQQITIPVGDLIDEVNGGETSTIAVSYDAATNTVTAALKDGAVGLAKLDQETYGYITGKGLFSADVEFETDQTYGIQLPVLSLKYFTGVSVSTVTDPTYGVDLDTIVFSF